jgi:hypothetical protein
LATACGLLHRSNKSVASSPHICISIYTEVARLKVIPPVFRQWLYPCFLTKNVFLFLSSISMFSRWVSVCARWLARSSRGLGNAGFPTASCL